MFTGLIDDVGRITAIADTSAGRELRIVSGYRGLIDGESIAVNGACLTVLEHGVSAAHAGTPQGTSNGVGDDGEWFTVAAVVTTLGRTTIGEWTAGTRVNLERAMRLGDRLGGHLVLGHVDDIGVLTRTGTLGDAWIADIALPDALLPLMVLHGSLTVNGVSLTVNALLDDGVQISVIEYTRLHTTLGNLEAGARVHIEADVLAKHVARLLAPHLTSSQHTHAQRGDASGILAVRAGES